MSHLYIDTNYQNSNVGQEVNKFSATFGTHFSLLPNISIIF